VFSLADRISLFNEEVSTIYLSSKGLVKHKSVKRKLLNGRDPCHTKSFAVAIIVINIRRVRFNINSKL